MRESSASPIPKRCAYCGSYEAFCMSEAERSMCSRSGAPQPDPLTPEIRFQLEDLRRLAAQASPELAEALSRAADRIFLLALDLYMLRRYHEGR